MAHDFNNLLTAILGYTDLLKRKLSENNIVSDEITRILTTIERGRTLTSRILTFTGSREITKKPTNLNQFLSEFASLTRRLIRENIEIKVVLPEEKVVTNLDAGLLEQALLNLAVNARDAMPSGGTLTFELGVIETRDLSLSDHFWIRNP